MFIEINRLSPKDEIHLVIETEPCTSFVIMCICIVYSFRLVLVLPDFMY